MKKNLFKKPWLKSIMSIIIMISMIVCALGSFELLLLGLTFRTTEELPDGRTQVNDNNFYFNTITTGRRIDGKWDGLVERKDYFRSGAVASESSGKFINGKKNGEFTYLQYNGLGEVVDAQIECYFVDVLIPCIKSAFLEQADEKAVEVLINKYPYFFRDLQAYHFEGNHVSAYIDSLESLINAEVYDDSEFDDYYDDAIDQLETGIYDSLSMMHNRLVALNGLDELKQSEFRMAVIDHHRKTGTKTFSVLQTSYPNYLKDVNGQGVNNTDFEAFCAVFDSIMASYTSLDVNNFFFPDSIDVRLYRALDMIYKEEYKATPAMDSTKSALLRSPELLKKYKEAYEARSGKELLAVDPSDVAAVVGILMEKHYDYADKVMVAMREAYLKKGNIIALPVAGTLTGDTISSTSINIIGNILDDGGDEISARGIAWANFYNPTINDDYKVSGSGLGEFTVNFDKLDKGKTYYYRAYARNSAGTAYGNCVGFMAGSTGIQPVSKVGFDHKIYPNPFSESATLEFNSEKETYLSMSVFDVDGRLLCKKDFGLCLTGTNHFLLNREGLGQGIYFYRIENTTGELGKGKFMIRD